MNAVRVLARRIRMLAGRAVVNLVTDTLDVQGVQLGALDTEVLDAQRFQEYGFTSVPLPGAEGVFLAIAGVRGHAIVVATDDGRCRRKNLQPGEVALYTDEGDYIQLARGKKIVVNSGAEVDVTAPAVKVTASSKVTVDTPTAEFTGDLSVDGDATIGGIDFLQHVHPDPQGGATGVPE